MPSRKTTEVPAVDSGVVRSASLEIDGRTLRLVYDFNAIAEAEREAGCNLLHGISATLLNTMTAAQLRGLFFAATRRFHPKLTVRQTGQMITIRTMPAIMDAICEAYRLSIADPENPPQAAAEEGAAAATQPS